MRHLPGQEDHETAARNERLSVSDRDGLGIPSNESRCSATSHARWPNIVSSSAINNSATP
jgi:hypothetical protein